jgi:hypothetical protein
MMVKQRHRFQAFGRGQIRLFASSPGQPVLIYARGRPTDQHCLLIAHNLSATRDVTVTLTIDAKMLLCQAQRVDVVESDTATRSFDLPSFGFAWLSIDQSLNDFAIDTIFVV